MSAKVVTLQPRAPAGFRTLPHNLEAEAEILGAILADNEVWRPLSAFLKAEHFYEPVFSRIFTALDTALRAGRKADWITLKTAFDQDDALRELNGAEYLERLAHRGTWSLNGTLSEYGRTLVDLAVKRGIIKAAEDAANVAYDGALPSSASEQLDRLAGSLQALKAESAAVAPEVCSLPALDLMKVANQEPPPERWLIEDWMPVGTAGVLAGPGSSGKSYLELIRMICLATGTPWLGYQVNPTPCLGYFSEDQIDRIWFRVRDICRALQIDPARLAGRLEIISTVGQRRVLFEAERFSSTVVPTDWLPRVQERARKLGARFVVFDHVGRLAAINRNDPNQVFDMWSHLDGLASAIDGCVSMLTHPSKADLTAGRKDSEAPQVGGSIAMIDAPRWVHILRKVKPEDGGERYRALTSYKANYREPFAIKLVENASGIIENVGDLDPDNLEGREKTNNSRGRPSGADATLAALREMCATLRRAIALDELVHECGERGIVRKVNGKHRIEDARKVLRAHIAKHSEHIEITSEGLWAGS